MLTRLAYRALYSPLRFVSVRGPPSADQRPRTLNSDCPRPGQSELIHCDLPFKRPLHCPPRGDPDDRSEGVCTCGQVGE